MISYKVLFGIPLVLILLVAVYCVEDDYGPELMTIIYVYDSRVDICYAVYINGRGHRCVVSMTDVPYTPEIQKIAEVVKDD